MRIALSAAAVSLLLWRSPAAAQDLYRLQIKGSGKALVTRRAPSGDLSIQVPADFQAAATLAQRGEAWIARDAEISATILGQKLRLSLAGPPEEQVSVEVNGKQAGSGNRADVASVPLLGAPLILGAAEPDDYAWQVHFDPPLKNRASQVRITLAAPGGGELMQFTVKLKPQQAPGAGRSWTSANRLTPVELPAPGNQTVVVNRVVWNAHGTVAAQSQPMTASISLEAAFTLPGGAQGTLTAEAQASLTRVAPESP